MAIFPRRQNYVYLFHDAPLCLFPRCCAVSTFSALLLRYDYFFHAAALCLLFHAAPLRLLSCADPGIFVGGGGGSRSIRQKKALTMFFIVLSLFYRSQMFNFKENFHFTMLQTGGSTFSWRWGGGGSNFSQGGGPIAYSP